MNSSFAQSENGLSVPQPKYKPDNSADDQRPSEEPPRGRHVFHRKKDHSRDDDETHWMPRQDSHTASRMRLDFQRVQFFRVSGRSEVLSGAQHGLSPAYTRC